MALSSAPHAHRLLSCLGRRRWWFGVERGKILQEEPMNEDVAASYLAQEDAFCGVIEKPWIVPGDKPTTPEKHSQNQMLESSGTSDTKHDQWEKQENEKHREQCEIRPNDNKEGWRRKRA